MAFADELLSHSTANIIMVDKHSGPGGHWNDAYAFVRLHQPSAYYGVNSLHLGQDTQDTAATDPLNEGMFERATGAEVLSYYQRLMQNLLATGRLQYFSMHEYSGVGLGNNVLIDDVEHRFKSLLTGETHTVTVHKKIVDSTFFDTAVPSTHAPKYAVAAGVRCIPLNDLVKQAAPASNYVVVGSGKTGIDACLWLLDKGVSPDAITWIMPRDAWYQNRAFVQPSAAFFTATFGGQATQMEAAAQATSVDGFFTRLETAGVALRLDPSVTPSMYHGAVMSVGELQALRQIKNVVRMGRVVSVSHHEIVLQQGRIAVAPNTLFVDCSASAVQVKTDAAQRSVFEPHRITLQMIRALQPTFSAAMVGYIETQFEENSDNTHERIAQKNKLCAVVPAPDAPADWLRTMQIGAGNQQQWSRNPALRAWMVASRLDGLSKLAATVTPEDTEKFAVLQRFGRAAPMAMGNIGRLLGV